MCGPSRRQRVRRAARLRRGQASMSIVGCGPNIERGHRRGDRRGGFGFDDGSKRKSFLLELRWRRDGEGGVASKRLLRAGWQHESVHAAKGCGKGTRMDRLCNVGEVSTSLLSSGMFRSRSIKLEEPRRAVELGLADSHNALGSVEGREAVSAGGFEVRSTWTLRSERGVGRERRAAGVKRCGWNVGLRL